MDQISEVVVFRLLMAKSLLDRTRLVPVAEADDFFVAQQVLTAHDAADLAIAAIADHCGAKPKSAKAFLTDYIAEVETKTSKDMSGRTYMGQLNTARNNFKHSGILPHSQQFGRATETVYGFVETWCTELLGISFEELDHSALLRLPHVQALYSEAKEQYLAEDFKEVLVTLAKALHLLLRDCRVLPDLIVGIARSEDAIKLSGFGVPANDYLTLQEFLPRIAVTGDSLEPRWTQAKFGHPANWGGEAAAFCLRAFLDLALKIQSATGTPRAVEFSEVYRYEIRALEEAIVSTSRPVEGEEPDEVLHVLKKGETLIARNLLGLNARPNIVDVLMAARLQIAVKKMPECLRFTLEDFESYGFSGGYIDSAKVKVTCVPFNDVVTTHYYPDLPSLEWDAEFGMKDWE